MSETPSSMNQAFKVAIVTLVFIGIFAAGSVTGVVITAHYASRRVEREREERRGEIQQLQQQAQDQARQASEREQQEQAKLADMISQLRQQVQQQQQQAQVRRAPPAPAQFGPQLMQRFVNQIKPTPEQIEQIRPLVFQAAEDLRRLRLDTAHNTELTLEHLQDKISALLTPDQQVRFDELIQRSREAFRRYNLNQQMRQEKQRQMEQRQMQRRRQWQNQQQAQDNVTISIDKDGSIYFNNRPVSDDQLGSLLEAAHNANPEVHVFLKADEASDVKRVTFAEGACRKAGFEGVGLETHQAAPAAGQ